MMGMANFGIIVATFVALQVFAGCLACNIGGGGGAVRKLGETRNLTFRYDEWVSDWSRQCRNGKCHRATYYPQLRCWPEEGTAGCKFDVKEVICFNKGVKDGKVQWRCSAPKVISFPYRFGMTNVWCHKISTINNPNSKVYNEDTCGLVYTVDYVVHPLTFVFTIGLATGVLVMWGLDKMYYESRWRSSLFENRSQAKRSEDIVFDDDYIWGRLSRRRRRGPHSTGGTATATLAAGSEAEGQEGGGDGGGDRIAFCERVNKVVIDEDEDDGALSSMRGSSSLVRLSSRTISNATTLTPFPSATTLANGSESELFNVN